jgi:geranylgeranyl pyrophosphate synthase
MREARGSCDGHDAAGAAAAIISSVLDRTLLTQPAALADVCAWALQTTQPNERFLRLPWLAYQATCRARPEGGSQDPHRAAPVAAAWHLLHCAAKLLDDVEDGGQGSLVPAGLCPAQAINAASALIFVSQLALAALRDLGLDASRTLDIAVAFNAATSRMAGGQAQDLDLASGDVVTLERLRKVQEAKSGEFFALICRAGAMLGDASDDVIAACAAFGYNLGMLVQIGDDLRDLWAPRGHRDLATVRCTLPLVYALSMADADLKKWIEGLLERVAEDGNAVTTLQKTLAETGAAHYAALQAGLCYLRARQALLSLPRPSEAQHEMLQLLDRIFPAVAMEK